jgi:hypothetical protein
MNRLIRYLFFVFALWLAVPAFAGDKDQLKCGVNQDRVWMYDSLASMDVNARLKCNENIEIVSRVKGYVKVRSASGAEGYVPDSALPDLPPLPDLNDKLAAAGVAASSSATGTSLAAAAKAAVAATNRTSPAAPAVQIAANSAPAAPAPVTVAPVTAVAPVRVIASSQPAPPVAAVAPAPVVPPSPAAPVVAVAPAPKVVPVTTAVVAAPSPAVSAPTVVTVASSPSPAPMTPASKAPTVAAVVAAPAPVQATVAAPVVVPAPAPVAAVVAARSPVEVVDTNANQANASSKSNKHAKKPSPAAPDVVPAPVLVKSAPVNVAALPAPEKTVEVSAPARTVPVRDVITPSRSASMKNVIEEAPIGSEYPDTEPANESADPACHTFFAAYGLSPSQFKWLAANRQKLYPSLCPSPNVASVDFVILFTHDEDTYNSAMPVAVHTDRSGFSDFNPLTTIDTALLSGANADRARQYVWVFRTPRGGFDPMKFSPRRRPQFATESKGAPSRAIEDAFRYVQGQGARLEVSQQPAQ